MQDAEPDPISPIGTARRMFSPPRIDRNLVTDFFMTFARAEFALKRAGYVAPGKHREPKIKWEDFARSIGDKLLQSRDLAVCKAIGYLAANPPRRQVVDDHGLTWEPRVSDDPKDPVFLIRSITCVRNNLFHGGKEIQGLLPERDLDLIRNSLTLLAYAVTLAPSVVYAFEELPPEHDAA